MTIVAMLRLALPCARAAAAAAFIAIGITACGSASAGTNGGAHTTPATTAAPIATPGGFDNSVVPVPLAGSAPVGNAPWMLAVGDSITSGFTKDATRAGTNSAWPVQLQKLLAASGRAWDLYDTACPGETTTSYFTHCRGHAAVPGLPDTSQYAADLAAIHAHTASLKVILIDLGSNDLLAAQASSDPLSAGVAAVTRLDTIVGDLARAAPDVPIVLANFYDPFENAAHGAELPDVEQLNAQIAEIAAAHNGHVADFFAAFNTKALPDTHLCSDIDCKDGDIHPTIAGHAALARAAYKAIP